MPVPAPEKLEDEAWGSWRPRRLSQRQVRQLCRLLWDSTVREEQPLGEIMQCRTDRLIWDAAGGEGTSTVDVFERCKLRLVFKPNLARQYLDLEVAAPAAKVLEHSAPAHVEEEPGQPASSTSGEKAEGSDSRGLKAAKSAARRLLEDLVREQERQETMEAPTVPTPPMPHMPYSALEGARLDFLFPEPSGPPMIPPALPPVHRDRFQPYPPMWLCHFRLQWCTRLHGISAFCGKSDADGAKAGSHDGQMEAQGTPVPTGTEAGSHRGAEGGSHRGASSGSYDRTATFSDYGAAIFSKGGTTACYNYGAQTLDIDDPCGTARGTKRDAIDGSGVVPMRLWEASGPPSLPTTAPPVPREDLPMPTASPSMPATTVTMAPKMLPSTKVIPSAKLGGATSKAPAVRVIAVDAPDPVTV
ncbi:unnamed protein product, partial [Symbiodinium microadriaticum]